MELLEYWNILWKRKWLILLLFAATVTSAYLASSSMTPVYEATTVVMVREQPNVGAQIFEGFAAMSNNPIQNYVEILKSRSLAETTIRKLGKQWDVTSPEFKSFRDSVSVQPVQGTEVIRISVESTDPLFARDAANALVESFIEANQDANREEASAAKSFISEQLRVVEKNLRQSEDALQAFKESERIISPAEETKVAINRIAELESLKAEAVVGRQEAEIKLEKLKQQLESQKETLVSATTISNNPLVQEYKAKLAQLEAQLSSAQERYTDSHPSIVGLRAEISKVRESLDSEVEKIVSAETRTLNPLYQGIVQQIIGLQSEIVALESREDALDGMIREQERMFSSLPEKELELARLERAALVTGEIYTMLAKRYEEVRITEAMKTANVRVLDTALLPETPIKPRVKLNVAIAGFLGLFVGFGLAFLMEYLDTTVKSGEEIEELLGLPVLANIPDFERVRDMKSKRSRIQFSNAALKR